LFAQQEQQLVTKLPPRDSPSFFLLENLIVIKTSLVLPTGTSPCNPTNRKTWTAIERRKTTKAKLGNTLGNLERFVSFFFFFPSPITVNVLLKLVSLAVGNHVQKGRKS
jgi:hypothetical protein